MKKLIFVILLIIIIPYVIVSIFIKDETIKFHYVENNYVRVKREKKNIIESIPFEDYIVGVVSGEMPASFHIEALKAQAVAARSYTIKKMQVKNKDYDLVDSINDQVYLDTETLKNNWGNKYTENLNKIKKAVLLTKGEFLTYDNKVINAFFFSTSNGKTENCEDVFKENLPYLKSVESNWDENSPSYNHTKEYTVEEFYKKLNLNYNDNLEIKIEKYNTSGSVQTIKINNNTFKGTDVRYKLSLNSTYFKIEKKDKKIIITTKGNGHGVGMSQYGALYLANKGYTYDQILKHYYKNVEISKI